MIGAGQIYLKQEGRGSTQKLEFHENLCSHSEMVINQLYWPGGVTLISRKSLADNWPNILYNLVGWWWRGEDNRPVPPVTTLVKNFNFYKGSFQC